MFIIKLIKVLLFAWGFLAFFTLETLGKNNFAYLLNNIAKKKFDK